MRPIDIVSLRALILAIVGLVLLVLYAAPDVYEWGRQLLDETRTAGETLGRGNFWEGARGIFSTTLGALSGLVVVLFVGIYLAASPGLYKAGLLRLVPMNRRARYSSLLSELCDTLRWWL